MKTVQFNKTSQQTPQAHGLLVQVGAEGAQKVELSIEKSWKPDEATLWSFSSTATYCPDAVMPVVWVVGRVQAQTTSATGRDHSAPT